MINVKRGKQIIRLLLISGGVGSARAQTFGVDLNGIDTE